MDGYLVPTTYLGRLGYGGVNKINEAKCKSIGTSVDAAAPRK